MRRPLGSTDVSASGGVLTLVGRTGAGWQSILPTGMPLADAIALIEDQSSSDIHPGSAFARSQPSGTDSAEFFAAGQPILWRYGRMIETARVIRDDAQGLVVWIPSGTTRRESVLADGRRTRELPLEERFTAELIVRESTWTGPGIVRVAPTGKPWSVWFFRAVDGAPQGAYINLEVPHRRVGGDEASIFTRDLVLDLWVGAEHPGSEDIWLKDADELAAAVEQQRFTSAQADAIRAIGDHAAQEFVVGAAWPLDEGWERWIPDAEMDAPMTIPQIR